MLERKAGTATAVPNSSGTLPPRAMPPLGAVDAHMHVFDPRFPFIPGRSPDFGTVEDYLLLRKRLGLSRCVVTAPSSYGYDPSCLIDALSLLGDSARGVASVPNDASAQMLQRLHQAGVRAIRLNFGKIAGTSHGDIALQAKLASSMGWHLEINMPADELLQCEALLQAMPVTVVIDHMGKIPQPGGAAHPVVGLFKRLVDRGNFYIKLDYFYESPGVLLDDYGPLVTHLAQMAPDRVLWGSGWNHADRKVKPDDARVLDKLFEWVPQLSVTDRILVHNPHILYWR